MRLRKLKLFDFRNYAEARLDFEGDIQCFFGKNGSGKTNLLDAIHYLSMTKSSFNPNDAMNVRYEQNQFFIGGEFDQRGRSHEVTCSFQQGSKKSIAEDGQPYTRFSKHIGKYPLVLIAPHDIELIWDGSELRRRFFDNLLSQINAEYLDQLIIYTQCLRQRNGLLKIFLDQGKTDQDLLDAWDLKLVPAGRYIFERRSRLMGEFYPIFLKHYRFLAGTSAETVNINYRSGLETEDFKELLAKNLPKDILLQRTGSGIHRDDFLFVVDGGELRKFGSQGQQKSFLIALKLAEFQLIAQNKGMKPLLLLDDIFDKLDDDRIHKLMELVVNGEFGQLLLTDARESRGKEILKETGIRASIYQVKDNMIQPGV